MRDFRRIPKIIRLLEAYWMANPDLRLCQLISNAVFMSGALPNAWDDVFHVEDDVFIVGINKLLYSKEEGNDK